MPIKLIMIKSQFLISIAFSLFMATSVVYAQLEDHSHHKQMAQESFRVTEEQYRIPEDIMLLDHNGQERSLRAALNADEPLMMQFIFATCPTVCPVLSASFAGLQGRLDKEKFPYRLVSITIDPEHDTVDVLADYRGKFRAGEHWNMYTGSLAEIERAQHVFGAYYGSNKMYHRPVTFIRKSKEGPWLRFQGLPSPADLYNELMKSSQE